MEPIGVLSLIQTTNHQGERNVPVKWSPGVNCCTLNIYTLCGGVWWWYLTLGQSKCLTFGWRPKRRNIEVKILLVQQWLMPAIYLVEAKYLYFISLLYSLNKRLNVCVYESVCYSFLLTILHDRSGFLLSGHIHLTGPSAAALPALCGFTPQSCVNAENCI